MQYTLPCPACHPPIFAAKCLPIRPAFRDEALSASGVVHGRLIVRDCRMTNCFLTFFSSLFFNAAKRLPERAKKSDPTQWMAQKLRSNHMQPSRLQNSTPVTMEKFFKSSTIRSTEAESRPLRNRNAVDLVRAFSLFWPVRVTEKARFRRYIENHPVILLVVRVLRPRSTCRFWKRRREKERLEQAAKINKRCHRTRDAYRNQSINNYASGYLKIIVGEEWESCALPVACGYKAWASIATQGPGRHTDLSFSLSLGQVQCLLHCSQGQTASPYVSAHEVCAHTIASVCSPGMSCSRKIGVPLRRICDT